MGDYSDLGIKKKQTNISIDAILHMHLSHTIRDAGFELNADNTLEGLPPL